MTIVGGDMTSDADEAVLDELLRAVDALPPDVVVRALLEAGGTGPAVEALTALVSDVERIG